MSQNIIKTKSYDFALRVIKLSKYLNSEYKEYTLAQQLLKSGTSIGALVREAEHAQSKADFIHKMSIALKEANETDYWINLLKDSKYMTLSQYQSIQPEIQELIKLLVSIIKTTKSNLGVN